MRTVWAVCVVFIVLGAGNACATPDCWGVTALNTAGKKVVRITCSNPNTPGTAPSYTCSYEWKVRTVDGVPRVLRGTFASVRGETNVLKYEESRVEGKDIDDEIEGISMSCHS